MQFVGLAVYFSATVVAAHFLVRGFLSSSPLDWLTGVALAFAYWWIAAGIGLRIGIKPDAYVRTLRKMLGFDHDPTNGPLQAQTQIEKP